MNRRKRPRSVVAVVAVAAFGLFAALSACSDNEEGERCNEKNGNDDCATGLVCVAANQLAEAFRAAGGDRCCPADRSTASAPACRSGDSTLSPPPDSSVPPTEAGVVDTGTDSGSVVDAADAADAAASDADDDGG